MTRREYRKMQKLRKRKIQVLIGYGLIVLTMIIAIGMAVNAACQKIDDLRQKERGRIAGKEAVVYEDSNEGTDVNAGTGEGKEDDGNLIEDEELIENTDIESLPYSLQNLYENNEEAREFVLGYWKNKNQIFDVDLSEYEECEEVPHLLQWDKRWGYEEYSGDLFGITGCGPTCLSMAAIYLLKDTSLTPKWMKYFSEQYGYSVEGNGSAWTLISEGGRKLGLSVEELSLSEDIMSRNLYGECTIVK